MPELKYDYVSFMISMQCWKHNFFSGSVFIVGVFIVDSLIFSSVHHIVHQGTKDQVYQHLNLDLSRGTGCVPREQTQVRRRLDGHVHGGLWIKVVWCSDSTIYKDVILRINCKGCITIQWYIHDTWLYMMYIYIRIYIFAHDRHGFFCASPYIPECLQPFLPYISRTHKSSWTKLQSASP